MEAPPISNTPTVGNRLCDVDENEEVELEKLVSGIAGAGTGGALLPGGRWRCQ